MKKVLFLLSLAVMLAGCTTKHAWMDDDEKEITSLKVDRFIRKIENKEAKSECFILNQDCVTYFSAHPEVNEDTMKVNVFPIGYLKEEIARGEDRLEYDLKAGFWLGLWARANGTFAFDEDSGKPVGVGHLKLDRLLGALYSREGEVDFETETAAGRSRWLFGSFGNSFTHSGKKFSYYFWIPFERSSSKKQVAEL